MGKKSFQRIILGLLAITSLMISACSTGSDDDSPPTHYTVTFYSSVDAGADTTSVTVPVRGQIDSEDFPDAFAVDPGDGRVFLEWSIYPTGKGAIVDEDSIITSSMSLYPIWGYEITDLTEITILNAAYKLTSDIELAATGEWRPIGIGPTNSFTGVLYGDGHIVTGLSLYTGNYNGLFGVLDNAYIRDLHIGLDNTTVVNANFSITAGGLAGQAYNGTVINNVSVSGDLNISLSGDGYVGLIVGKLENGTINNSFSTGNLTASSPYNIYLGGIAGHMDGGTVDSNYVLGVIVANTASTTPTTTGYAGGITGYADSGSVLSNNVVVSPSISSANSGRIAGYSNNAQFSSNYSQDTGSQTFAINDQDGASVAVADLAFFRSLNWDFNNAWAEPAQQRVYQYPVAKRANGAVWVDVDFDTASDVSTYQVVYDYLTDISSVPSTSAEFLLWNSMLSGRGSSVNAAKTTVPMVVYAIEGVRITTTGELAAMAAQLNTPRNYMLVNDLNLSNYGSWTPIGNTATPFAGIFYGNGHTISGINLPDTAQTGLFGVLSGAYIHGLTLDANTVITTAGLIIDAGALAGVINTGTDINDITVTGSINIITSAGNLSLGGIAGQTSSDINNSRVSADIFGRSNSANGYSRVGGLVGMNNNAATVQNSVSTGDVQAYTNSSGAVYAYAGGIAGQNQANSMITTSYSTGEITAVANSTTNALSVVSAGGIVGYNYGNIFATYSTGDISASNLSVSGYGQRSNAGGIAGQSEGIVSVSYSTGDIDSYAVTWPHSAGIVGDMRNATSQIHRSVGANTTLTAVTTVAQSTYSGRIVGYNNSATLPAQANNYANNNMSLNNSVLGNSAKNGTGKSMSALGLQQTYESLNSVAITGAETLLWDFVNTWKTDGQSLPTFIWQN